MYPRYKNEICSIHAKIAKTQRHDVQINIGKQTVKLGLVPSMDGTSYAAPRGQCAKRLFTFVNLEKGRETHPLPPRAEMAQA